MGVEESDSGPSPDLGPLSTALRAQRARDLLGPDPIEAQIEHSRGFARVLDRDQPDRVIDLGSGGGLPGLVLALVCWPDAEVSLVDASQRRCTYLELVVQELGLAPRVSVRWARAEELGREEAWRAASDVVVARSFGPPAVVAECSAPLLRDGGRLVVSEPPAGAVDRWPAPGLAPLGLVPSPVRTVNGARYAVLAQVGPCSDAYPRRPGLPGRRPLF